MEHRTPIGGTHARDWGRLREQRPLSDLAAGPDGYVRFACGRCARTGKMPLAALHARFPMDAGLVNVLNAVAPEDCGHRKRKQPGEPGCGWYYRDLATRAR